MCGYIQLKKDFSNFDEVLNIYNDEEICITITENAYAHLIDSSLYSFSGFIEGFDLRINDFNYFNKMKQDFERLRIEIYKTRKAYKRTYNLNKLINKL